jgi:hypothetical protein
MEKRTTPTQKKWHMSMTPSSSADGVINNGQGYDYDRWVRDKRRFEQAQAGCTVSIKPCDDPFAGVPVCAVQPTDDFARIHTKVAKRRMRTTASVPSARKRKTRMQRFFHFLGR